MQNSLLPAFDRFVAVLGRVVWGWPMIVLILGVGLLLSVRSRFLQLRGLRAMLGATLAPTAKSLRKHAQKNTSAVSPFAAFATALSGTVGTGNIIGVVAAILSGGPGALLWMWVSAFFGMMTAYAEIVLGMYFRRRDPDGGFSGGAFYTIARGLKRRRLACLCAILCLLSSFSMCAVQTDKIASTLAESCSRAFGLSLEPQSLRLIIAVLVALTAAVIILGGAVRVGRVASLLVPFMSLLFIVLALAAILRHSDRIPAAFSLIFSSAFRLRAAGGGLLGYTFSTVVSKGMARGVFSNEAGLGSSVIAHTVSDEREPAVQGFWGMLAVFCDTFVICTLSALMFLTAFDIRTLDPAAVSDSVAAVTMFSSNFGAFGTLSFSLILPLFAFTTVIAWSLYGEKAVDFLFSRRSESARRLAVMVFKTAYILGIAAAPMLSSALLWELADVLNGLTAIPNLICLISLSHLVSRITENYLGRRRGIPAAPMLFSER